MDEGIEVELYKIDERKNIIIINIRELSESLKLRFDQYIGRIWTGDDEEDIKLVKKEILEYITKKDRKKQIGAIAEFFVHLYLNFNGYTPLCLFQNLEENSFKKGFDGYFVINDEEWIVESKSTEEADVKHHSKIKNAYEDLKEKVEGKTSNNPWKNAHNHARMVTAPEDIQKKLKCLAREYSNKIFHKLSEYNIIPCSTKYIEESKIEKSDSVHNSVLEKINVFEFNKISAICINNMAFDLFMEYLRS